MITMQYPLKGQSIQRKKNRNREKKRFQFRQWNIHSNTEFKDIGKLNHVLRNVGQKLLTLLEDISSPPFFNFSVPFYRTLFVFFSFCRCSVCLSIFAFWLPYLSYSMYFLVLNTWFHYKTINMNTKWLLITTIYT